MCRGFAGTAANTRTPPRGWCWRRCCWARASGQRSCSICSTSPCRLSRRGGPVQGGAVRGLRGCLRRAAAHRPRRLDLVHWFRLLAVPGRPGSDPWFPSAGRPGWSSIHRPARLVRLRDHLSPPLGHLPRRCRELRGSGRGVRSVTVDGRAVPEGVVELADDGGQHKVQLRWIVTRSGEIMGASRRKHGEEPNRLPVMRVGAAAADDAPVLPPREQPRSMPLIRDKTDRGAVGRRHDRPGAGHGSRARRTRDFPRVRPGLVLKRLRFFRDSPRGRSGCDGYRASTITSST